MIIERVVLWLKIPILPTNPGSYNLKVERKNYAKYWKILKKKKSTFKSLDPHFFVDKY